MGYLNCVWMAATVAMVQGHTDQGYKPKSGKKRFFSTKDSSDLRPLSGMVGSDISGVTESRDTQADESLRRVMYLNCWGQV